MKNLSAYHDELRKNNYEEKPWRLCLWDDGLQIFIFRLHFKTGAFLGDPREVAVTNDSGIRIVDLQGAE